ncbi:MAG: UDP-N-acetylmuramate--L-alanine ligase [Phycisphaerales bacterium]|jgi:UDP-N-acetylmuramate--alanine ligase|nr:UDP-N-acetylmuramate--L-alanine ligase [Phycisphaerales bacterium]MBT7171881.1 UDP-N-acetylmuramate--L-alanine ligase [Phycisphaerales bacterium]
MAVDDGINQTGYADVAVHLIGAGGSGMRALGQMLMKYGARVSGSDMTENAGVGLLRDAGASIAIGQRGENIPADVDIVVYSAAIREQNPELLEAHSRGVQVVKYAEMLGQLMGERVGIAIAGTHGKSTTSAMVAYVLQAAGKKPNFIIGAMVDQLGGPSGVGGGDHFVAEACEFDRSFLHLQPKIATILNLEEDHLDCYRDLEEIIEAFRAFVSLVPADGVVVVNGDDRNALEAVSDANCRVETFGLSEQCTWCGEVVTEDGRTVGMVIYYDGDRISEIKLPLPGLHNAYNTLMAFAVLRNAGLSAEEIAATIGTFAGAKRRLTLRGQVRGITVVDDFAHHPTELQASLRALSSHYQPRRMYCVFQPHQHSRTRFLLKDFAQSFGLADEVIVPDIYFVRDSEKEKDYISAKDLVAQVRLRGGMAFYMKTFDVIVEYLKGVCESGDLIVTMGAGNIWEVSDAIIQWLERDG